MTLEDRETWAIPNASDRDDACDAFLFLDVTRVSADEKAHSFHVKDGSHISHHYLFFSFCRYWLLVTENGEMVDTIFGIPDTSHCPSVSLIADTEATSN